MTVAELIEILEETDSDAEVYVDHEGCGLHPVLSAYVAYGWSKVLPDGSAIITVD